jgi:pimeloyl-ACP methyl ester carboxylesterase
LILIAMVSGCITNSPVNPSFSVAPDQARKMIDDDTANPKALKRPLLIVGGFFDPGIASAFLAHDFRNYTHDDRIIRVALGWSWDTEEYRQRIIDAVDKAFPSTDPVFTTEVDVIGYSMGGLASRYAAMKPPSGPPLRRLRIARLFTISSPHLGALSAMQLPHNGNKLQDQMWAGSQFLNSINNHADADNLYPVYSYVCLGDKVVGAMNAAPPGQTPWWVSPPIWLSSHDWAFMDPRIRADILCRLRDEPPLTHDPPTPLPAKTVTR